MLIVNNNYIKGDWCRHGAGLDSRQENKNPAGKRTTNPWLSKP